MPLPSWNPPVAKATPSPSDARGPCVLFLHGAGAWGGQWVIWHRIFEAEGFTVEAPDRQPAVDGIASTRFEDYVTQTVDAIVGRPTAPVLLVGASLGGLIALAALGRLPSEARPRALVLVNPVLPSPCVAGLPPFEAEGEVVPWRAQGRFASTCRALPQAAFPEQRSAFLGWRDESAGVLREAHAGVAVATTGIPTLVIASDDDGDVPADVSRDGAALLGASVLRVPGGHLAPVMGASAVTSAQAALAWGAPWLSMR